MTQAQYDVALICLNGHIINSAYRNRIEKNQQYCEKCGSESIYKCAQCENEIRGTRYWLQNRSFEASSNASIDPKYELPKFCIHCGEPYPWTKERLRTLREYILSISELSEDDKTLLLTNLDDLIKSTPRADLAVSIWKKVLENKQGIAKIIYEYGKDYFPSLVGMFSANKS